jgi:hypothetical protein
MTKCIAKLGSASLVAFAMAGCNYEEPARFPSQEAMYDEPDAPDTFMFKAGTGALTVKVDQSALWGPDVQLSYYGADEQSGSALRGKVWRRIVDVDLGETRARGFVGGTPLQVAARRDGNLLRASGWVDAKDIELDLGEDKIVASIGDCRYDLHPVKAPMPRTYEGTRACAGGDPVPTTMRIPRELDAWPAPAAAAGLGILLSSVD